MRKLLFIPFCLTILISCGSKKNSDNSNNPPQGDSTVEYFDNSQTVKNIRYKDGSFKEFEKTGRLKVTGLYNNNMKEGTWKYLAGFGPIDSVVYYQKDKAILRCDPLSFEYGYVSVNQDNFEIRYPYPLSWKNLEIDSLIGAYKQGKCKGKDFCSNFTIIAFSREEMKYEEFKTAVTNQVKSVPNAELIQNIDKKYNDYSTFHINYIYKDKDLKLSMHDYYWWMDKFDLVIRLSGASEYNDMITETDVLLEDISAQITIKEVGMFE